MTISILRLKIENISLSLFTSRIMRNLTTSSSFKNIDGLVSIEDNFENKFVRKITMTNEKQRNSLSLEMIRALQKGIDSIDLEKCRVLVINSNSSKVFSSGHNLKELTHEFERAHSNHHETVFSECTRLCLSLRNIPIPTIAQVAGLAAAAGFQLASSCDLIVASSRASFSTPGVKFGLFCTTPGVPLSRQTSSKISLKMLFTGEPLNASEALQCGLVSELVDGDEAALDKRVLEIARLIEMNPRGVVALGKRSFYEQIKYADLEEAYRVATKSMIDNLKYEDTQSGLKAFAAKTKPKWSHSDKKLN